jgi:HK97 family phage portal protein
MNKLEKFVKTLGIVKSDIDRYFLRNLPPSSDTEALQDPYSNVAMVYTCISTTARAISQVPVMVTQLDNMGNNVPVGSKHPWQKLIDKPNYMMSRSMFIENVLSFWLLDGNVCIIPFPVTSLSKKGVPDSLWAVRWKFMSYEKDKNGHISKWIYQPNNLVKVELAPQDVLHLKFFNPNDAIEGLAPHEAGKIAIRSNFRAGNYNSQFFENGAVPGGILQTDKQLSKATFERTKSQVNQEYGVKEGNAHKLMVLEQGLKWAATGITQRDMEYIGLYRLTQEEIMQIYGMKKVIISADTGGANRATAQVEKEEWWHGTCMPLMRNMMEIMSWGMFEFRDLDMSLTFDISSIEALAAAFGDKAKNAEVLLRLGFTRNEVNERLELGFPKVPWGDVAYMPVNMMPVNLEGGTIQPGGHGGEGGDNPNPNNPQDNPGGDPQDPGDKPEDAPNPSNPDAAASSINTRPPAKEALLLNRWKQLTHMSSGFEDQLKGKVERVFFDMRKVTLDMFNKDKAIEDLERMSYDLQKSSLIKFASPILAGAAMTGATSAEEEFDMDSKTLDNESMVLNFLNSRTIVLRSIIDTVKSDVLDNLRSAVLNDKDAEKAIKDAFNAAKNRAKTIARTEVMSALNYGRHSVIIRSPYSLKEWFSPTGESRHSAMNGKQVGTQEHWQMPDGTILGYPTDMAGGAKQCANCQCVEFIVN